MGNNNKNKVDVLENVSNQEEKTVNLAGVTENVSLGIEVTQSYTISKDYQIFNFGMDSVECRLFTENGKTKSATLIIQGFGVWENMTMQSVFQILTKCLGNNPKYYDGKYIQYRQKKKNGGVVTSSRTAKI